MQHNQGSDCMDRDSVLYQLMEVRMDARMGQITEEDCVYQATVKEAGEYSKKLDALKLPRETTQLIDRYVNAQTEQGSRYGDLAYILGFSDCIELLLDKDRFPCVDEHDGKKNF